MQKKKEFLKETKINKMAAFQYSNNYLKNLQSHANNLFFSFTGTSFSGKEIYFSLQGSLLFMEKCHFSTLKSVFPRINDKSSFLWQCTNFFKNDVQYFMTRGNKKVKDETCNFKLLSISIGEKYTFLVSGARTYVVYIVLFYWSWRQRKARFASKVLNEVTNQN